MSNDDFETRLQMMSDLTYMVDNAFLLATTPLIFWMQAGFTLLEAGSVRAKNTVNILLKNFMDVSVIIPVWYVLAFGVAFGQGNGFMGLNKFFGLEDTDYSLFMFEWTFASAAITIVSGATAERIQFPTYLVFSVYMCLFIYAPVAHWLWTTEGFLAAHKAIDFAGSGVVHLVGGTSAIWGAIFLKPRIGRFGAKSKEISGHSITLATLGTFVLWFGWFGFNCGSSLALSGEKWKLSANAMATTMISPAAGAFATFAYHYLSFRTFNLTKILNGLLCGLAAITGPCAFVTPTAAVFIGVWAAVWYEVSSRTVESLRIDDPLDAFSVHGAGGVWGLLAAGLFATPAQLRVFRGAEPDTWGLLLGGGWELFGMQVATVCCLVGWVTALAVPYFLTARTLGLLRISIEAESAGLDRAVHGETAYAPLEEKISTWVGTRVADLNSM